MNTVLHPDSGVLHVIDQALALARLLKDDRTEASLSRARERFASDTIAVGVAGEFKRGKSSLVNNLLNDDLCPVDVDVTTCIVSRIRYGDPEQITLYQAQEGRPEPVAVPLQRSEIAEYAAEQRNRGNVRQAVLLDIQTPNENLGDAVVMFDTPGVGGLNSKHTAVAYQFLPYADIVLYVFSATDPLTRTELEFINRLLPNSLLVLVMTKPDLVPDPDGVLNENVAKVASVTGRSARNVPAVAVNNRAHSRWRQSNDKDDDDLRRGNFGQLQECMRRLMASERHPQIVRRALGSVSRAIGIMAMPLRQQHAALTARTHSEIEENRSALNTELTKRSALLTTGEWWESLLSREVDALRSELTETLANEFRIVRGNLDTAVRDRVRQRDPQQIQALANADLSSVSARMQKRVDEGATRILRNMVAATGIELRTGRQTFHEGSVGGTRDLPLPPLQWHQPAMELLRGGVKFATLVPPAALAGPLVYWVGAAAFLYGVMKAAEIVDQGQYDNAVGALENHFRPQLDRIEADHKFALQRLMMDLRHELQLQLRAELTQQKAALDQSLARLNSALEMATVERDRQLSALQSTLHVIAGIERDVELLGRTVEPAKVQTALPLPPQEIGPKIRD